LHECLAFTGKGFLVSKFLACVLLRPFRQILPKSRHGPGDRADFVAAFVAVDDNIKLSVRQFVEPALQTRKRPGNAQRQHNRQTQKSNTYGRHNETDCQDLLDDQRIDASRNITGQKLLCPIGRPDLCKQGLAEGIECECRSSHHDDSCGENHGYKPALYRKHFGKSHLSSVSVRISRPDCGRPALQQSR